MHMAAGFTVASVSANATGLFTHAGGIQAIAANGPVSLQAHTDQLEILADKAITIVSVNDVIEVKANQKIVLQAGQSSVTLEGGNITFACPGNFTVKGGQHNFGGGMDSHANMTPLPEHTISFPVLPIDKPKASQVVVLTDTDGHLLKNRPYRIWMKDGSCIEGSTDKNGCSELLTAKMAEAVDIQILKRIT